MTPAIAQPDAASDAALLDEYVAGGSEDAFRILVERHLPLVHAAARRQVREAQLADDVTQAVFILLARKARSISNPALLPAWLLKVTHYASLDARKTEARRRSHERKAAQMSDAMRDDRPTDDSSPLLPFLDAALARLRDPDRAIVAMRFLEGRTMSEVGVAAGISEAAAAKRIERALAKLRGMFKRRGIVLPATGAIAMLTAARNASAAVIPIRSADAISATAISAARGIVSGAAASLSIAKGAGQIMAIAKAKTVAVIVSAAVLTIGGGGMLVHYVHAQNQASPIVPAVVIPSPNPPSNVKVADPIKSPAAIPAPEEKKPETPEPVKPPTLDPGNARPAVTMGITGTVKFDGTPPVMPKIDMSAVAQCAQHHDGPVLQETAVVGKDGGLANVVVSIKKEEGTDLPGNPPIEAAVLDQNGCQYSPHVVAVMVGQVIVVKNSDGFLHNVHTLPEKNEGQNIAQPTVGIGKLKNPKEVEYFRVKCDVHPWMNAWIAVLDNPYFAVTDKDGKFTLPKGLPDGHYTLHAWHEKFGEQDAQIAVKDGCATAEFIFRAK